MVMNKVLFLKMPINLSKSLTSTCSAGTLNGGPQACRCQSSCHLKHFSPLSVPRRVCQSLMGDQIAATAAAHPRWICIRTVFLPRRETFLPLWVWRVSAAQDEAGRFNPANVFSMVNRRSEFDNRYELINSAPSQSRTRLQSETMFFDQVTAAHHFKHWYLFIKTSTLLIFFSFCKNVGVNQYKICMVIWETSSSLHKRKKCHLGIERNLRFNNINNHCGVIKQATHPPCSRPTPRRRPRL